MLTTVESVPGANIDYSNMWQKRISFIYLIYLNSSPIWKASQGRLLDLNIYLLESLNYQEKPESYWISGCYI